MCLSCCSCLLRLTCCLAHTHAPAPSTQRLVSSTAAWRAHRVCRAGGCFVLPLAPAIGSHANAGGCLQVCWRGDNVTVPFNVTRGAIPTPAAVRYNLTALAGNLTGVAPRQRSGHISLAQADLDGEFELHIPVNWSAVPADAALRWGLQLQPTWLSQTPHVGNDTVAVHLFGVEDGQCPPGTTKCATQPPLTHHTTLLGCAWSPAGWQAAGPCMSRCSQVEQAGTLELGPATRGSTESRQDATLGLALRAVHSL